VADLNNVTVTAAFEKFQAQVEESTPRVFSYLKKYQCSPHNVDKVLGTAMIPEE